MATTKMVLNKAVIATLPPGTYADSKQKGLILKVTEHSRRWSLYCWLNGRPTKKAIGVWPEMDVMEARRMAAALVGGGPVAAPKGTTLDELATLYTGYLESMERKTSDYVTDAMRLYWSDFADRDIATITPVELAAQHAKLIKARGPSSAKRAITTLRTLYHYAAEMELTEKNPAKKVRMVPEKTRDVHLSPYEITVFRKVLTTMYHPTNDIQDYFTLLLETGLRRSNVAGLRWSWWHEGTITVPAAFSKNGEEICIPLNTTAEDILVRRQAEATSGEYVFPSAKSACGHLVEPWFWKKEIIQRMADSGVTKSWTIHDLRRTMATELTRKGAPLPVVAAALGHRNVQSTPIYARASTDTVREWLGRQ